MPRDRYSDQGKNNACYRNKATDPLIFKEFLVRNMIRTLLVNQVSIDSTMITMHAGNIYTEAEIDAVN